MLVACIPRCIPGVVACARQRLHALAPEYVTCTESPMSDKKYRDRFPPPPDATHPSLRFARYIVVDWASLAFESADDATPEQLEAAKAKGALLSKNELLQEWRKRYEADQRAT